MKENQKLNKSEAIAYIACKLMEVDLTGDAGSMAERALNTYIVIKKTVNCMTMKAIREEININQLIRFMK
ncbi:MAG: hypothetical protein CMI54_02060 [Parcubacteria group bacterium]|jgi:urease gamma subunit|nr:hypothetical protein [Parcubacteria group bacterium]|tara:strand:- start:2863 stop:3072 length:210 start_codon:yes stop_codon:yes gene_type:complete